MNVYDVSWGNLLLALLLVCSIYWALVLLSGLVWKVGFPGISRLKIYALLRSVLVVFEPVAFASLVATFILINPVIHGLIVICILIPGYLPLLNYLSGRILLFSDPLSEGEMIKVKEGDGIIQKVGRLGCTLQTKEGARFINYSRLLSEGFTRIDSKAGGGLHLLEVDWSGAENVDVKIMLENRLFTCPFLDWNYKPEITRHETAANKYKIQVLVSEDNQLNYLVRLIEEWGVKCIVVK